MKRGQLFVVSAPSGAGKTSLVKALLVREPSLQVSVSHTTRAPRAGEQTGVDYHFVTEADFQASIQAGAFLEHANVFGYHYGTHAGDAQHALDQGFSVLLEIDCQGALAVKQRCPEAVLIFVLPPSRHILRERLTKRASDHPDVIEKRLAMACHEVAQWPHFDFLVLNDDFQDALEALAGIVQAGSLLTRVQSQKLQAVLSDFG